MVKGKRDKKNGSLSENLQANLLARITCSCQNTGIVLGIRIKQQLDRAFVGVILSPFLLSFLGRFKIRRLALLLLQTATLDTELTLALFYPLLLLAALSSSS